MRYASPETRAKMLEQREARQKREEAERAERIRKQASKALREVDDLFRRADRESDPTLAGELRAEADAVLEALLSRIPTGLYGGAPWHEHARRVRETSLFIPEQGLPLMPGDAIGVVRHGTPAPQLLTSLGMDPEGKERGAWFRGQNEVRPRHFIAIQTDLSQAKSFLVPMAWPAEDPEALRADARQHFVERLYRLSDWLENGWGRVSADLRAAFWPDIEKGLLSRGTVSLSGWVYGDTNKIRIPLDVAGRLVMMAKDSEAGVETVPSGARLIPPTEAGWSRFLALARQQGGQKPLSWTDFDAAARFWWQDRRFPRGFFKSGAET